MQDSGARFLLWIVQQWSITDLLRRVIYYGRNLLNWNVWLLQQGGLAVKRLVEWFWGTIPSYLPFYLLVVIVLYAVIKGRKPVTVIAPFHLPSENELPFGEHTVANAIHDAFVEIRRKAEAGIHAHSNDPIGHLLPGLEGLKLPAASLFEVPTRFAVEVKGLSHEALISLARKVLGKERVISGDVMVDSGGLRLLARSGADTWSHGPCPATIAGLERACHELVLKALRTIDPTWLAAYEIVEKKFGDGYCQLHEMARDAERSDITKKLFELAATTRAAELIKQGAELHKQGRGKESVELLEEATKSLEEASALLPHSALVAYNLGVARAAKKEHTEAIAAYRKALDLNPEFPEARNNIGVAFAAQGKYDEAINYYKAALSEKPDYSAALFNLGNAFSNKQEFDQAIDNYQKALKTNPDNPVILHNLGLAFYYNNQLDEAIDSYQKALRINPDDPDILSNLGIAFYDKGQYNEAIDSFRKALEAKPDNPELLNYLDAASAAKGEEER